MNDGEFTLVIRGLIREVEESLGNVLVRQEQSPWGKISLSSVNFSEEKSIYGKPSCFRPE